MKWRSVLIKNEWTKVTHELISYKVVLETGREDCLIMCC